MDISNEKVRLLKEYISATLALTLFVALIGITHLSLYNDYYPYYETDNVLFFADENIKEGTILKTPEELWYFSVDDLSLQSQRSLRNKSFRSTVFPDVRKRIR